MTQSSGENDIPSIVDSLLNNVILAPADIRPLLGIKDDHDD